MQQIQLLINGEKCLASQERFFERRNPLDGEVATRAPAASVADAVRAVEAAKRAFPAWSRMGPGARRGLLLKAAAALEAKADAKWGGTDDYEAYKQRTPVLIPKLGG